MNPQTLGRSNARTLGRLTIGRSNTQMLERWYHVLQGNFLSHSCHPLHIGLLCCHRSEGLYKGVKNSIHYIQHLRSTHSLKERRTILWGVLRPETLPTQAAPGIISPNLSPDKARGMRNIHTKSLCYIMCGDENYPYGKHSQVPQNS